MLLKFLFPGKPNTTKASLLLLIARVVFGGLLLSHGLQKLTNFQELSAGFPDPLGIGSPLSLGLAVFAEVFCSLGFIFGALYRLALIPMIITMGVAVFVIHANDPLAVKELALAYLVIFTLLYVAGPGKYSIDNFFAKRINKKR